jgi:hypothetical protein
MRSFGSEQKVAVTGAFGTGTRCFWLIFKRGSGDHDDMEIHGN